MNPKVTTKAPSPTIEEGMKSMAHDVRAKATGTIKTFEKNIRKSPDKAVLIALAAGYCLHVLPVRTLIALPLRLTAFLAKPALFAFGAVKVCEAVQRQARK